MSMTDNGAPVATDTAPATTEAPASNGSGGGSDNDWIAALPEDTRKTAGAKGWKSPADAVKSYTDLFREYTETKTKSLTLPTDDAKPEDWDAFFTKVGRPEKAEGYEFKLPEGLPEGLPYDGKSAEAFKNWAHEAGLTPKQAQAVHDNFVKHQAATVMQMREANEKAVSASHEALVKVWGDPSSETYKRNQELANRALRNSGGQELISELKAINALGPNGEVKSPRLAQMLAKVGQELYAEDTLWSGPGGGEPNPFARGPSENLAKQGEIIRSDPERARVLIRQAGIDPKAYRL